MLPWELRQNGVIARARAIFLDEVITSLSQPLNRVTGYADLSIVLTFFTTFLCWRGLQHTQLATEMWVAVSTSFSTAGADKSKCSFLRILVCVVKQAL